MADPPESIGWTVNVPDLGFVSGQDYQNPDIICHEDAKNAQLIAPVAAGSDVTLEWTPWPDSHHGPVITYLASCNGDCTTVDKTQLEFFKIDAKGLIDDSNPPGQWATDQLIANNMSWTTTIPSDIASGNYVMRHEIIALHSAGQKDGAQNYPFCINFQVTGGGSTQPSGTPGEQLYQDTDPGILISIYQHIDNYQIPGPPMYDA